MVDPDLASAISTMPAGNMPPDFSDDVLGSASKGPLISMGFERVQRPSSKRKLPTFILACNDSQPACAEDVGHCGSK